LPQEILANKRRLKVIKTIHKATRLPKTFKKNLAPKAELLPKADKKGDI
jgi:hypothetical protein